MKKWNIHYRAQDAGKTDIVDVLLTIRGFTSTQKKNTYLHPENPSSLTAKEVGIDQKSLKQAVVRIQKAIKEKESVVVYADYDADGITAGALLWETLHGMGAKVMPYIPHRVEEGYGLSIKGIDAVRELFDPSLIITVDHGITAYEKVEYAKQSGIDMIVTDHHSAPEKIPDCTLIHTTILCGAGVSWFLAKELSGKSDDEILALAAIGSIADMMPLTGINRSVVKFGLEALNKSKRIGLVELFRSAGVDQKNLRVYDISHIIAPRLNAMGRLEHAMDALRLLCTPKKERAVELSTKLALVNRERQTLTEETVDHAMQGVPLHTQGDPLPNLLFISHESYNQGIIGLVAGKLTERFYRPSIVVSVGEIYSKASARSIRGFNIIEAIRSMQDLLVDVGGHPMAAGFTVETTNITALQDRLEEFARDHITEDMLVKNLDIDIEMPLSCATESLWEKLRVFEPFGFGNTEPVFASRGTVGDLRLVGSDGKHLKLKINGMNAIAFGMGEMYGKIKKGDTVDIAYTLDMNEWNGKRTLQMKVKDIRLE